MTTAHAISVAPAYSAEYTAASIGSVPGVPALYGGLTLKAGDSNTLLIGGSANDPDGAIYSIGVTRDANNHITGFAGSATLFSTAPYIDGGLAYAPNGTLLYTGFPSNEIGEIKTGSTTPDKIVSLSSLGYGSSVGGLAFVPNDGRPGAGEFKVVSYTASTWYSSSLTPDGSGTYDINPATSPILIGGGPEGIAYVPLGSDLFPNPSVLISEYGTGLVVAYETDANGDPIPASRTTFISGLTGAEGAFIDPLTGDFLFSTFGGGDQVIVVQGFAPIPEPPAGVPDAGGTLVLLTLGTVLSGGMLRRNKAA